MSEEKDPQLLLLDDPEGQVFDVPEGRTRIGRAAENDVRLRDKTVSRFHCNVMRSGREVRVEDTDSHNSTRVNGLYAGKASLQEGDILRVGRLRLRFHDPSRPAPSPVVEQATQDSRRTRETKKRGPAMFPLLVAFFATLGLSWLYFTAKFPPPRQDQSGRSPGSDGGLAAGGGLAKEFLETQRQLRLQNARLEEVKSRFNGTNASMSALQRSYQRELDEWRQAYEDRRGTGDVVVQRQIASLEATIRQLVDERETDRERFTKQLEETKLLAAGAVSRGGGGKSRSSTSVRKLQRPRFSRKEGAALVKRLRDALENYASPEATPASLEPELGSLSGASGVEAAKGMLDVREHGCGLLEKIDANVAYLKRQTEKLLAQAKAAGGGTSEGSNRKREGSNYKAGPEVEKLQRKLELPEKKISIKGEQRKRLEALVAAVNAAFGRMTEPQAARYLRRQFARNRDVGQRLAILNSMRASGSLDAIPVLIERFSAADETVRKEVRQALISISGSDLGGDKANWEKWWREQKL